MRYFVYVLISLKDKRKYIGSTNDLAKRIQEHNDGKVESTVYRRPLKLIYYEVYVNEKDARRREKYLKGGGRARKNLNLQLTETIKDFLKN